MEGWGRVIVERKVRIRKVRIRKVRESYDWKVERSSRSKGLGGSWIDVFWERIDYVVDWVGEIGEKEENRWNYEENKEKWCVFISEERRF